MNDYLLLALECAYENLPLINGRRDGGPFGAVIVRNGEVIAKAHNSVNKFKDPTKHAEMVAIQEATKALGQTYLSDCEIYCSCFPCAMCLGAIYWARIPKVIYGSTTKDSVINSDTDDTKVYKVFQNVISDFCGEKLGCIESSKHDGIIFINSNRDKCNILLKKWTVRERPKKND